MREDALFTPGEVSSLEARSTATAIAICLLDAAVLTASLTVALRAPTEWAQLVGALVAGAAIGALFIVGHDAAHNSLTSSRRLNRILGQIAFLPSLHPFSHWVVVHNQRHHRWANLATKDGVWTPLSLQGYRSLPTRRRLLYRFYRGPLGPLAYYAVEFWWKQMCFPPSTDVGRTRASKIERTLVFTFAVLYTAFLVAAGRNHWFGDDRAIWNALVFGALLPFLVWNAMMSLVIYGQHTHPRIRWYDDEAEWRLSATQEECAAQIVLPWHTGGLIHHVMAHNAHHVRPGIPFYHLVSAQDTLRSRVPAIVVEPWRLSTQLDIVRRCKLYDYRAHRWMDFAGRYTS